jgi:hypothetical protein
MYKNKAKSAYSLLELAVVIVITSLLIGGLIATRSMLGQAKIQGIGNEYQTYKKNIMSFKELYSYLPGDAPIDVQNQLGGTAAYIQNVNCANNYCSLLSDNKVFMCDTYNGFKQMALNDLSSGINIDKNKTAAPRCAAIESTRTIINDVADGYLPMSPNMNDTAWFFSSIYQSGDNINSTTPWGLSPTECATIGCKATDLILILFGTSQPRRGSVASRQSFNIVSSAFAAGTFPVLHLAGGLTIQADTAITVGQNGELYLQSFSGNPRSDFFSSIQQQIPSATGGNGWVTIPNYMQTNFNGATTGAVMLDMPSVVFGAGGYFSYPNDQPLVWINTGNGGTDLSSVGNLNFTHCQKMLGSSIIFGRDSDYCTQNNIAITNANPTYSTGSSTSGGSSSTPSTSPSTSGGSSSTPSTSPSTSGGSSSSSAARNIFPVFAAIDPQVAKKIDIKFDDGLPLQGAILGLKGNVTALDGTQVNTSANACNSAASDTANTQSATYLATIPSPEYGCRMGFIIDAS